MIQKVLCKNSWLDHKIREFMFISIIFEKSLELTPWRKDIQGWKPYLNIKINPKIDGKEQSSSLELQSFIKGGFGEKNGEVLFWVEG